MKFAVGLIAGLLLLVAGCSDDGSGNPASGAPALRTVVYEVEGETGMTVPMSVTSADITIATKSGTEQASVAVPLVSKTGRKGLTVSMPDGAFVYISAQNKGRYSSGKITCRITSDGVVISENTSSGKFAIASCKGRA